jgi:enoyl-CoA hydratase
MDLETSTVVVDEEDGVRWVRFNRPESLNAFTLADLRCVIELMTDKDRPKAAVLTGTGNRAFSAGMHLQAFPALDSWRAREFITIVRDAFASVRRAPYPVVAAVNGHCLGAGLGFAMAADVRIVTPHATFGLPEVKAGVPSVCDNALLQQFVGLGYAKEIILTGDAYPVQNPAVAGLVNQIVEADELASAVTAMIERTVRHAPAVIELQKQLFETWQNTTLSAGINESIDSFSGAFLP